MYNDTKNRMIRIRSVLRFTNFHNHRCHIIVRFSKFPSLHISDSVITSLFIDISSALSCVTELSLKIAIAFFLSRFPLYVFTYLESC